MIYYKNPSLIGGVFCFKLYLYDMRIIITEEQYNLLFEQSMGGMSSGQSFAQHSTSSAKMLIDKFSKYSLSQFMEDLRNFLASGEGIIVQVVLEVIPGIGQIINVSAWALLALYDVMLGTTKNQWNWLNLIVDAVGIITTGPGGKWIKNALSKVSKYATGTIESFVVAIKKYAPKALEYIVRVLKGISSVTLKIASGFKQLLGYLGKYFKNSPIYKGLVKLEGYISSGLSQVLGKIEQAFGKKAAQNTSKAVSTTKHVGQHAGQHYVQHNLTHAAAAAVVGGGHHT